MKKKIAVFVILFSIPVIASAQWVPRDMQPLVKVPPPASSSPPTVSVSMPEQSLTPMIIVEERLSVWPASDCNLRYQDWPPADETHTVAQRGHVQRVPYLTVMGSNARYREGTDDPFGFSDFGGFSFVCPVHLPAPRTVTKVTLTGSLQPTSTNYYKTWINLQVVSKAHHAGLEIIEELNQELPGGYFTLNMNGEWTSRLAGFPTYLLIRVYAKTEGGLDASFTDQIVDLDLLYVTYKDVKSPAAD